MDKAMTAFVELLRETMAEVSACRAVAHALIATHPDRDAVRAKLLEAMDLMADVTPPERIPLYREALQRYCRRRAGRRRPEALAHSADLGFQPLSARARKAFAVPALEQLLSLRKAAFCHDETAHGHNVQHRDGAK